MKKKKNYFAISEKTITFFVILFIFIAGVSWMNIPLGFIQVLVSGYGLYGMYEVI